MISPYADPDQADRDAQAAYLRQLATGGGSLPPPGSVDPTVAALQQASQSLGQPSPPTLPGGSDLGNPNLQAWNVPLGPALGGGSLSVQPGAALGNPAALGTPAQAPPPGPAAAPAPPPSPPGAPLSYAAAGGKQGPSGAAASPTAVLTAGPAQPARWNPTTRDVTEERNDVPPEARTEYETAIGQIPENIAAQAGVDARAAQLSKAYLAQWDAQAAQVATSRGGTAQDDDTTRQHKQDLAAAMGKYNALMDLASSEKIDPSRWFSSMGIGQKIAFILGSGVAAFGHGYTGRGTDPMETIKAMSEQSVRAQMAQAENLRAQAGGALTTYGLMKQQFASDDAAKSAAMAAQYKAMGAQLQRDIADPRSPAVERLGKAQLAAQVNRAYQDETNNWIKAVAAHVTSKGSEKYTPPSGGGAGVSYPFEDATGRRIMVQVGSPQDKALRDMGLAPTMDVAKNKADLGKTAAETASAGKGGPQAVQASALFDRARAMMPLVQSTAYDPTRALQGTDANHQRLTNDAYNALAMTIVHSSAAGLRSPELVEQMMKGFRVDPGDTPSTIEQKKTNLENFMGQQAGLVSTVPGFKPIQ